MSEVAMMASGGGDEAITPPPLSRLKQRASEHNLSLDIESAQSIARTYNENHLGLPLATCIYSSPECRTAMDSTEQCACNEDIEEEGKELFENFVKEEIAKCGLENKAMAKTPWIVETPFGYKNPAWAKAGRELREMADAFSRAREEERGKVKQSACSMNVAELTYSQFRDLLSELFINNGISTERIMLLFLFCSDLALNNLETATAEMCMMCMEWVKKFIIEKLCSWVKEHGGWRAVLSESVQFMGGPQVLGLFAVIGAVAAIFHWMRT